MQSRALACAEPALRSAPREVIELVRDADLTPIVLGHSGDRRFRRAVVILLSAILAGCHAQPPAPATQPVALEAPPAEEIRNKEVVAVRPDRSGGKVTVGGPERTTLPRKGRAPGEKQTEIAVAAPKESKPAPSLPAVSTVTIPPVVGDSARVKPTGPEVPTGVRESGRAVSLSPPVGNASSTVKPTTQSPRISFSAIGGNRSTPEASSASLRPAAVPTVVSRSTSPTLHIPGFGENTPRPVSMGRSESKLPDVSPGTSPPASPGNAVHAGWVRSAPVAAKPSAGRTVSLFGSNESETIKSLSKAATNLESVELNLPMRAGALAPSFMALSLPTPAGTLMAIAGLGGWGATFVPLPDLDNQQWQTQETARRVKNKQTDIAAREKLSEALHRTLFGSDVNSARPKRE